jgi:hypothetical protein
MSGEPLTKYLMLKAMLKAGYVLYKTSIYVPGKEHIYRIKVDRIADELSVLLPFGNDAYGEEVYLMHPDMEEEFLYRCSENKIGVIRAEEYWNAQKEHFGCA